MSNSSFRRIEDHRWQEWVWYLTFLILYAWSSHAITYSKKDGWGLGGDTQWPCHGYEYRTMAYGSVRGGLGKFIQHQNGGLMCSSVCMLGRVSFWLSAIAGLFYVLMTDKARKIYKYFLMVIVAGMITLTALMNIALAIRSIPAYFCLGALFSIEFSGTKSIL